MKWLIVLAVIVMTWFATPSTAELPRVVSVDSLLVAASGDSVLVLSQALIIYRGELAKAQFVVAEREGFHVRRAERLEQIHRIEIEQRDWVIRELEGSWWERVDEWVVGFALVWAVK